MGVVSVGKSELCGQSECSKNREGGKHDDHILYFANLALFDHTAGGHQCLDWDGEPETGLWWVKRGARSPRTTLRPVLQTEKECQLTRKRK